MADTLQILSGGAAKGVVEPLRARFLAEHGLAIEGEFGAVGLMKDKLLAGTPCDVVVLTESIVQQLTRDGQVEGGSARALGVVKTGIAMKAGEPRILIESPAALKAALLAAEAIYFPDPEKATAGIHFMNVLRQMEIAAALGPRLRTFPNGAAAMQALAEATGPGLIGCTQVTEILYTPGVQLVGPLPVQLQLATVYTAAVCARARQPKGAAALVALLGGPESLELRRAGGFEID